MINLTRRSHLIGLGAGALSACASPAKPEASGYVGTWSGVLDDGTLKVRVRLYIESESRARIVIVDQGVAEFETTLVSVTPDGISIEFVNLDTMTGSLAAPDTLRLASSAWAITVDFVRGDLWPPELLTRDSLAEARRASGSPAMGLAYAKASGPVTVLVDGLRSIDDNVPATRDDRWLLASVSKSMTATLVARLIEAGGITWDTTVADLLSDTAPGMLDVYKRVSFRHLLSHHAGLQPNIGIADFMTFSRGALDDAREERLRYATFALKQEPTSTPGEAMLYANNGYVVTGAMLEARYGLPWEKLIEAHVFQPLGIGSFGFGPPGTPGQLDQPLGHMQRPDTGELIPGRPGSGAVIDNPYAMGPTGRIHMNLDDLITYLRAHLQRPEAFLAHENWMTLHTPPFTPGAAMGWFTDGNTLRHGGTVTRWQTLVSIDRARGVVAAAAANTGTQMAASAIAGLVLNALHTAAS